MVEDIVFWTFLTVCVVSFCVTRVTIVKLKARERSGYTEDDTRTTQEIHQSLERMQKRVEALETLLIENETHARAGRVAAEIERL